MFLAVVMVTAPASARSDDPGNDDGAGDTDSIDVGEVVVAAPQDGSEVDAPPDEAASEGAGEGGADGGPEGGADRAPEGEEEVAEAPSSADATSATLVVRHRAPSNAAPGEPLELVVEAPEDADVTVWLDGATLAPVRDADRWVVRVAAKRVQAPGFRYAIAVRRGDERWHFASERAPHRVQVIDGGDDPHGRALDVASDGRVVEIHGRFRYGSFGRGSVSALEVDAAGRSVARRVSVEDDLYTVEAGASYRLHGPVHALGIDVRIARGRAPSSASVEGAVDPTSYDVALQAGVPQLVFRLAPGLYGGPWFLLGGHDRGFAWGAGGSTLFGDPHGSHFSVRGGFVARWGAEVSAGAMLAVTDWLAFGSTAELTGAPRGESLGVGVTGDLALRPFAGFTVSGRAGFQTREGIDGGPIAGGGISHAF